MKTKLLTLLLLFVFFSCNDSGRELILEDNKDPAVTSLILEVNSIDEAIGEGLLLRSATEDEKKEIKTYLYRARIFSLKLQKTPHDRKALENLYASLKKLEKMDYTQRDRQLFTNLITSLRKTIISYSQTQNIDFEDLAWEMKRYLFNISLRPFKEVKRNSKGASWEHFRNQYAKIGARGEATDSWLMSERLDFSKLKRVSVILEHTVRNPIWNKFEFLISDNYDGQDPLDSTWTSLKIKPKKNVASDKWENLETGKLNLNEFAGKEVVIAFRYTSDSEKDTVWEIEKVSFVGSGGDVVARELNISYETPAPVPEYKVVFEHNFKNDLGEFTQEKTVETSADFRVFKNEGTDSTLRISSFSNTGDNGVGTTRLVSPVIDLKDVKEPAVNFNRVYKFYPEQAQNLNLISMQVRVAGTDEWDNLKPLKFPSGKDYNYVESGHMKLAEKFKNKMIEICFKYESTETLNPLWDIKFVELVDLSEKNE